VIRGTLGTPMVSNWDMSYVSNLQTIALFTLFAAAGGSAQEFEVASVKPSSSNDPRTLLQVLPGGGLRTSGATVRFLVTLAYQVRSFQVLDGPGWIGSDRFDIIATVDRSKPGADEPADPTKLTTAQLSNMQNQMRPRLAALLAERFGLKVHREMREQPIYELVVTKGGPKIEAVTGNFGGLHIARNQFVGEGATVDMLSTALANQVERPVVDRTGLVGSFNFKLNWTPPDAATPNGPDPLSTPDQTGPSIFTAVREQLGLELKATKGLAEVLIIDHVERPSAN
jgi:bla regulator protein blaR1